MPLRDDTVDQAPEEVLLLKRPERHTVTVHAVKGGFKEREKVHFEWLGPQIPVWDHIFAKLCFAAKNQQRKIPPPSAQHPDMKAYAGDVRCTTC
jgi:hypothetical protein